MLRCVNAWSRREDKNNEQEQGEEQEQGQGQRREQGQEPGRELGQEQAGQAAGGGLFVCARKGAGDHQMRGGWGPSSDVLVAIRKLPCDCDAVNEDDVLQVRRAFSKEQELGAVLARILGAVHGSGAEVGPRVKLRYASDFKVKVQMYRIQGGGRLGRS